MKLPLPDVQLPCDVVVAPRVKPLGQVSVRVTPEAIDGPALLTTIAYVCVEESRIETLVTPSDFVTDRSALVLTVVVLLAMLLFEFGSGVLLVTLALFV